MSNALQHQNEVVQTDFTHHDTAAGMVYQMMLTNMV